MKARGICFCTDNGAMKINANGKERHFFTKTIILLTVFVVLHALMFSWYSWQQERSTHIHLLSNITQIGADGIEAYFKRLQSSMSLLGAELAADNNPSTMEKAYSLLGSYRKLHPELINITLIRPDGKILLTATTPHSPGLPSLATEASYIQYLQESKTEQSNIGRPLLSLITKQWIIPFRHQIYDKDQKLLYILSANIPTSFLEQFWRDAPLTQTGALGLMRDDGYLISRYPVPAKTDMSHVYGKPRTGALINYLQSNSFPNAGIVEGPSSLDGPHYFTAFQRMDSFPITLFATIPKGQMFNAWWKNVAWLYMLSAIMLLSVAFIYRAIQQQQIAASRALHESESKYRGMFSVIQDALLLVDRESFSILDANEAACRHYGYSKAELLSLKALDISAEPQKTEEALSSFHAWIPLRYHRRKDGSVFPVEISSALLRIDEKDRLLSVVRDISERLSTELQFKTISEVSPSGIWLADANGHNTYTSKRCCEILGLSSKETLSDGWKHCIHPDDLEHVYTNWLHTVRSAEHYQDEFRIIKNDGSVTWVLNIAQRIIDAFSSGSVYWVGTVTDITERVLIEQQTQKAIKEKEILLKEIHHRVKNNLQVISSLLGLQAHTINDEMLRRVFEDCQNRVKSMALVHERLYQSENIARVDFQEYITNITAMLQSAYPTSMGRISFQTDVQKIHLNIDQAVPCALIINELISNSLKYAFPSGQTGTIQIFFTIKDHEFHLLISDDGVGLPHDFDATSSATLGFQLVSILTQQLHGSIEIHREHGTSVTITFPARGEAHGKTENIDH